LSERVKKLGRLGQVLMKKALLESTVTLNNRYGDLAEQYIKRQIDFEAHVNEQSIRLMEKYHKPVIGVYWLGDENSHTVTEINDCQYKGINLPRRNGLSKPWRGCISMFSGCKNSSRPKSNSIGGFNEAER
jgi:hypothetical protein